MTGWRAIVPVNLGRERKTRLADRLSLAERDRLTLAMARHVVDALAAAPGIAETLILSPARPAFDGVGWLRDAGRGLNAELSAHLDHRPVLIVHADLPMLTADDVTAMIAAAAATGTAIAPDRAGTGTNALALRNPSGFLPEFGADSCARHIAALPNAVRVERPGLGLDIDTPEDLDYATTLRAAAIACPI